MSSIQANQAFNCSDILDAVKLGLILIDGEGNVLLWNSWMVEHSGISTEFALSRTLESLFSDKLPAPFKSAIKNALTHKLPIVLSNALHRTPLPIYTLPITPHNNKRMQQSITISPVISSGKEYLCLIQVTDASISVKRERLLQSQSERLSKEATTDSLTGAYNRRFFDERFSAEFGRAQRHSTPLSLIMLDVDYFKLYNDKYGHPAGDTVLSLVVNALKSQLNRPTDVVVRYGGEEFAVIMPDSGAEGGVVIAEKLRVAVSNLNIPHSQSKAADHVTVSIGVATYLPGAVCLATDLLAAADAALYNAKHSGRNCLRHSFASKASEPHHQN